MVHAFEIEESVLVVESENVAEEGFCETRG